MNSSSTSGIEARARWKAATLYFGLTLAFWVVSALSRATENARIGLEAAWHIPWVLEGSSLLVSAGLFFLVWSLEARWPIAPGGRLKKLAIHVAGSVGFSAIHVLLMVWIRKIYWLLAVGTEYVYLRNPLEDILYDYRKDAVTYATLLMIIYLSKSLEVAHAERIEARTAASASHRLVLKCGGKTVFLAAHEVEAVQADGNYVFVHTGNKSHHARLPLSDALSLLEAAGRDIRRVHKSWLIDFEKVAEARKTPKGDIDYRMKSGREIRGSRRYQHDLSAERPGTV